SQATARSSTTACHCSTACSPTSPTLATARAPPRPQARTADGGGFVTTGRPATERVPALLPPARDDRVRRSHCHRWLHAARLGRAPRVDRSTGIPQRRRARPDDARTARSTGRDVDRLPAR